MTQTDFLADLGRELDGAAGRIIRGQRMHRRRGILVPAAALAVAAAAAVAVWGSGPADPEREVAPSGTDPTLAEQLAVLRRPETDADRGPATQAARRALERTIEAPRTFRLLASTPEGEGVVLGAGGVRRPGPDGRPAAVADEGMCTYYPAGSGGGGSCWAPDDLARARAWVVLGDRIHGLAPDGVAHVHVDTTETMVRVAVRDNFYEARLRGEVIAITYRDEDNRKLVVHARGAAVPFVTPVPQEALDKARALTQAPDLPAPEDQRLIPLREVLAAGAQARDRVPYPPGARDRGEFKDMPTTAARVHVVVEAHAQCAWQRYWLAAIEAGDDAAAARAAEVLQTVPRWPGLRRYAEPHERVAFAVREGMVEAVAREVANCSPSSPERVPPP